MKLHLASFMQKENFGPGRIISITESSKPDSIEVASIFKPLTPPKSLIDTYRQKVLDDPSNAGEFFRTEYGKQLDNFLEQLSLDAKENNCPIVELLPFEDGDTLASWERAEYTNYRKILAPYLEKMGYTVVLN